MLFRGLGGSSRTTLRPDYRALLARSTLCGPKLKRVNCPQFLDSSLPYEILPLEFSGRQHVRVTVLALPVVKHLHIVERILPRLVTGQVHLPAYPLSLQ